MTREEREEEYEQTFTVLLKLEDWWLVRWADKDDRARDVFAVHITCTSQTLWYTVDLYHRTADNVYERICLGCYVPLDARVSALLTLQEEF